MFLCTFDKNEFNKVEDKNEFNQVEVITHDI